MPNGYTGWRAWSYPHLWGHFTERTLTASLELIDSDALRRMPALRGDPPRVLDVACGTGVLLRWLLVRIPDLEAVGLDASAQMLAQARATLRPWPQVQLAQGAVGPDDITGLPARLPSFDLITCTNALHYFRAPAFALARFGQLLAQGGQVVLEDYARREPPFPWRAFEWGVRKLDPGHVRAYTLAEACALCREAALEVIAERAFPIDWLWQGWALRAQPASTGARLSLV